MKLKYLLMEWFNEIPEDNTNVYDIMIKELDHEVSGKEKRIYDLIKLSYNKV